MPRKHFGRGIPEWRKNWGKKPDPLKDREELLRKLNMGGEVGKEQKLKKARQRHAKKGNFQDFDPRVEKGVFLRLFKRDKSGILEQVIIRKGGNPQLLQDAVDNLRKEISYYNRLLSSNPSKTEITLYNSQKLFVYIHKSVKGLFVKTVVEDLPSFGFSEAVNYYFNKKGNLVIECVQEKHKK